jgi:hypothetical protein
MAFAKPIQSGNPPCGCATASELTAMDVPGKAWKSRKVMHRAARSVAAVFAGALLGMLGGASFGALCGLIGVLLDSAFGNTHSGLEILVWAERFALAGALAAAIASWFINLVGGDPICEPIEGSPVTDSKRSDDCFLGEPYGSQALGQASSGIVSSQAPVRIHHSTKSDEDEKHVRNGASAAK